MERIKGKQGFTLVELIVVLVILAVLTALLVPALTGYIDKAKRTQVIAETRMLKMAIQTEVSELYGSADWQTYAQAAHGISTIAAKDKSPYFTISDEAIITQQNRQTANF